MISPTTVLVASPAVAAADLGGEAVLLDAEAGRYFGLNEVAARIVQLVSTPRTVADVEQDLLAEYDVDGERLRADLLAFVAELEKRALIEVRHGDHG